MARSLSEELDRTRNGVSRTLCWCFTIALHQEFGIGKTRLERLGKVLDDLQDKNYYIMIGQGKDAADKERTEWLNGMCELEFRVPMNRAARTRRERQIKMAGDDAASVTWQLYAKACIDALGFGPERLKRLKKAGWDNYAQFAEWKNTDGEDVAMERIRRCAEDALQVDMQVVDDDESEDAEMSKGIKADVQRYNQYRVRNEISKKPGYAVLSGAKIEQIGEAARASLGLGVITGERKNLPK